MTDNTTALTPAPERSLQTRETAADVLAAQAKATIEARYIVAMKQPRDIDQVREKLIKECKRPGFAAVAIYNKPIGRGVQGPSIRFAEAAIRCMTNMAVDTATIYDDEEKRIVRVTAIDFESNVPWSQDVTVQKTVERSKAKDGDTVLKTRQNSRGQMVYIIEATDDDILNKQNALISKAARTLGLRIVPGDIIEECMAVVRETQRKKDAEDPDQAKYDLFDAFGTIGVSVEELKEFLGHEAKSLTPKELADLRALYVAIRDGEATWREAMESRGVKEAPAPAATINERVKAKVAEKAAPAEEKTEPEPAAGRRMRF